MGKHKALKGAIAAVASVATLVAFQPIGNGNAKTKSGSPMASM